MDVLNPKEGDTQEINGFTMRVCNVVQDSIQVEFVGKQPTESEFNAVMTIMSAQVAEAMQPHMAAIQRSNEALVRGRKNG